MESAVFAMDTRQERELTVRAAETAVYGPREHIVRLQDTTIIPGWGCVLTPAEARRLAAALTGAALDAELADDSDDLGGELTSVPMVCTACRKSVYYRGGDPDRGMAGGEWMHDQIADARACTRTPGSIVTAMIAAGNQDVARA